MGKYFGTDGFRGEVNLDLTSDQAYKIGRFLGDYLLKNNLGGLIIGRDTRLSGHMFESAIAAGAMASGSQVFLAGVIPTPGVAWIVSKANFGAGVMISASHNNYVDNGIKIFNSLGEKMDEEILADLEHHLDGSRLVDFAYGDKVGTYQVYPQGVIDYGKFLSNLISGKKSQLKIGLDCANGSASVLAKEVFTALTQKVLVINDQPSGVNINQKCGSTDLRALQELVREQKLDLGLAFDGDADRCLMIDHQGQIIDGDLIMYVLAKKLYEENRLEKQMVVLTQMSNLGLLQALESGGLNYEITKVGDKYVYERMREKAYSFGGEQSGHIIFGDLATTGDGILTGLMMVMRVIEENKTLAELVSEVKILPQVLENVLVKNKEQAFNDVDVLLAVAEVEESLGKKGRILYRQSGTEKMVRVMVEAESEQRCRSEIEKIVRVLREKNLVWESKK